MAAKNSRESDIDIGYSFLLFRRSKFFCFFECCGGRMNRIDFYQVLYGDKVLSLAVGSLVEACYLGL